MKVGNDIEAHNADWNFGGSIPDNFAEHVRASIPFYEQGHDLVCQVSDFFCGKESVCYDIGASTGELVRKLALHHARKPEIQWIGVDAEPAMVAKAHERTRNLTNVTVVHDDVRNLAFQRTDLIVAYYTLQFVPPRDRQAVFDKIYQSLHWGGALVLFEKVRGPDARFQDMLASLYTDFKVQNGLTADEIVAKSRSLKGVLEPFSSEGNRGLLTRAGFVDVMPIFRYLCFEGIVAIK